LFAFIIAYYDSSNIYEEQRDIQVAKIKELIKPPEQESKGL
jgi:hypothetical protein